MRSWAELPGRELSGEPSLCRSSQLLRTLGAAGLSLVRRNFQGWWLGGRGMGVKKT